MEHVMTEKYGTRTDCKRDKRQTICVNSTWIGHSTKVARPGSWVHYEVDDHHHVARVVGRVHCEGKTYLEVITTDVAMTMAYVRWIESAMVRACYAGPHHKVMAFLTGEWKDTDAILTTAANGFVRD
jgi:hypothetical protein